jgi:hypothetical protein
MPTIGKTLTLGEALAAPYRVLWCPRCHMYYPEGAVIEGSRCGQPLSLAEGGGRCKARIVKCP